MNLIIHQMMQLQHIHTANRNAVFKRLSGTAVIKDSFAILSQSGSTNCIKYFIFLGAVEYRRCNVDTGCIRFWHAIFIEVIPNRTQARFDRRITVFNLVAELAYRHAQMRLQNLPDVHTRWYAQRIQHNINWSSVRQKRQVFLTHNARNDTLVAVTTGHFIADRNLTFLCNINADQMIHARRQFIVVRPAEHLDINDLTGFAMWNTQRRIPHFTRLFSENGPKKTLLCRQFGLAFRRNLADKDIARTNLSTDADNTVFIKIAQRILSYIGNIARDLFRSQFRIPGIALIFFNMDGSIKIALNQVLTQQHRILIVITFPRHISNDNIIAQSQFAMIRRRTIGNRLLLRYNIALINDWYLIDTGSLIGTQIFLQFVNIQSAFCRTDIDLVRRNRFNRAGMFCQNHNTRITGSLVLHAGADQRRLRPQKRHSLTLHVGTHKRTVRIIIFQEWNHRCSDRNNLLWRHIHIINPVTRHKNSFLMITRRNTLIFKPAVLGQRLIRLGNDDIIFLIRRQITNFIGNFMILFINFAVRRFHKSELIDPSIVGQRTDQSDIRTFRRLNRTHAPIMRIMNVTHLKSGALTRKSPWPQSRKTALMRQLGQRIMLIHEL